VLGLTFKEDVPDIRNSRVPDIVAELQSLGVAPLVHDPHADAEEVQAELGVALCGLHQLTSLDAVILAVPHKQYISDISKVYGMLRRNGILIDVRSAVDRDTLPDGIRYWSL
jgi:UDP-N-acetyl-D-galactosamine dehydrogenase